MYFKKIFWLINVNTCKQNGSENLFQLLLALYLKKKSKIRLLLFSVVWINTRKNGETYDCKNNVVRLNLIKKRNEHATTLSNKKSLHWLPIKQKVSYKSMTLCHNYFSNVINTDMLVPYVTKRHPRSSKLCFPRSQLEIWPFLVVLQKCVPPFPEILEKPITLKLFKRNWTE